MNGRLGDDREVAGQALQLQLESLLRLLNCKTSLLSLPLEAGCLSCACTSQRLPDLSGLSVKSPVHEGCAVARQLDEPSRDSMTASTPRPRSLPALSTIHLTSMW